MLRKFHYLCIIMADFKDFSALKGLRKELEKQENASEPAKTQQRRSHTVVHKTKDQHAGEQKAREMGLQPGCVVTMMDSNDRGILRHVHKDYVEIELDGLVIPAGFRDFVVNNPDEDRELMRRSGSSKPKKEKPATTPAGNPNELTIDLHIERIPGGIDAPEGFELPFQMEYFRRILRQNLRHRGMRINVIHGVGDGILRDEIRKEIDEVFAISCSWAPGIAGVTVITVK